MGVLRSYKVELVGPSLPPRLLIPKSEFDIGVAQAEERTLALECSNDEPRGKDPGNGKRLTVNSCGLRWRWHLEYAYRLLESWFLDSTSPQNLEGYLHRE